MSNKLTVKQQLFVELVAQGSTYSDAFREAYPKSQKWTPGSVRVAAHRYMETPKVRRAVEKMVAETKIRNHATLDEVIDLMSEWLRFDPKDLMNTDGCVKSMDELPKAVRTSISEIQVTEIWAGKGDERIKVGELKRIKFVDKRATADMFMRKFGAYIDRKIIEVEDLTHIEELLEGIEE